uniref:Uncharacterized protein n=1 Tax=Romanomermis culicivorax TaxID=13658 RepID=A0A915L7P1_ROMCU
MDAAKGRTKIKETPSCLSIFDLDRAVVNSYVRLTKLLEKLSKDNEARKSYFLVYPAKEPSRAAPPGRPGPGFAFQGAARPAM